MEMIQRSAEFYQLLKNNPDFHDVADSVSAADKLAIFLLENGVNRHFVKAFEALLDDVDDLYNSVFISYSMKDQAFADLLYEHLTKLGVRAWYAPKNMQGGKTIIEQVKRAIDSQDRVVLILSESSLNSTWVASELRLAHRRERSGQRNVLFPIRLVGFEQLQAWELHDSDSGTDLAHHVRSYFVPDFSDWNSKSSIASEVRALVEALKK